MCPCLSFQNVYRSDLQWMRGIGWLPSGSLDDEKNKRAALILSDKKYRQHPDTIKFTSIPDSMPMVLAKHNSAIMDQVRFPCVCNLKETQQPPSPGRWALSSQGLGFARGKVHPLASGVCVACCRSNPLLCDWSSDWVQCGKEKAEALQVLGVEKASVSQCKAEALGFSSLSSFAL